MTPEAQRIAIAEACPDKFVISSEGFQMAVGNPESDNYGWIYTDPLNDLNAMREAENTLRGKILPDMDGHPASDAWTWYGHILYAESVKTQEDRPWNATAAQRAAAFLKTIGKWEDDK